MALQSELAGAVAGIFRERWTERDGNVVPSEDGIKLGNDAVKLHAVVVYADMAESTSLVDAYRSPFAAEVYRAYLHCAAKVVRSEQGDVTAYDGDRIMAVFIGDNMNTRAVRAALKINWCRVNIVNKKLRAQYPDTDYHVKHTIGVDRSDLFVARTGIRGSNDLVWVGRAANHAAKLCDLGANYPIRISDDVYKVMHDSVKVSNGSAMWQPMRWTAMADRRIYRSTFMYPVS